MRTLRLISTTAAILLLGAGAVSAQGMKTNETPSVPALQQNAPAEKMAPAGKSDQVKAPEKIGQAAPKAQQTTDKGAPASTMAKDSSDANGSADMKSKRTARHVRARYAGAHYGPFYNSYRGDRYYRGCRGHGYGWTPWLWC
jgi:hypothetical protein